MSKQIQGHAIKDLRPLTAIGALATIATAVLLTAAQWSMADNPADWPVYGADNRATKYSPLEQINGTNVHKLQIGWRWSSPDREIQAAEPGLAAGEFQATPIMVDGMLYATTAMCQVAAIDPASGKTLWRFDPETWRVRMPTTKGFQHRGVAYWNGDGQSRLLLATGDSRLIAIDAKSGAKLTAFGEGGTVNLRVVGLDQPIVGPPLLYGHTSAVTICRDTIVVGSYISDRATERNGPPGDVRGFDVRSGKLLWTFHTIPRSGEVGNETWENDSWKYTGAANVWAPMSADDELGYVYLPVSTPTNNFSGVDRPGAGLFGESIVCLDARTGRRIWHYQLVHHGIWDYDTPAAPNLVDLTINGAPKKALAQITKQGFCYVLDRVSGVPVWPIEERAVPQSDRPGEKTLPTQPFPTRPPAFDRQGVTENDLIDFTPQLHSEAIEILKRYKYGPLFTPRDEKTPTIFLPGWVGGANWFGAAADPETGLLYIPSVTMPMAYPLGGTGNNEEIAASAGIVAGPQGLPLIKPPYSRVTVIDLNRGEVAWSAPLGEGPTDHPAIKDLKLGRLGSGGRGKPLLTKTLLFIGEGNGAMPNVPMIHAFDKQSGELLWQLKVDGPIMGAPMTYSTGGKQYIVFACGTRAAPHELVALTLP